MKASRMNRDTATQAVFVRAFHPEEIRVFVVAGGIAGNLPQATVGELFEPSSGQLANRSKPSIIKGQLQGSNHLKHSLQLGLFLLITRKSQCDQLCRRS